jgi:hypothetical protein
MINAIDENSYINGENRVGSQIRELMQLREEGTLLLNYRELTEIIGYLCRA